MRPPRLPPGLVHPGPSWSDQPFPHLLFPSFYFDFLCILQYFAGFGASSTDFAASGADFGASGAVNSTAVAEKSEDEGDIYN